MATFIPVAVEPSEKTKAAYRDLQAKGEELWKTVKAKKQEAQKVLHETKTEELEPFPVKVKAGSVAPTVTKKSTAKTKSSTDEASLPEELQAMIHLSSLIYAFAAVRKSIAEGGIKQSKWPWSNERKQLDHYELIQDNDTKMHKDGHHDGETCASGGGCLKKPLDGTTLEKVLTPSNMEHLSSNQELANELNVEAILAMKELGPDGLLWEFDDHFGDRQLVYAITVNKAAKRVTIIFRGSTVIQDWFTNLTIGPKKLDLPECLQDKTDLGFDVEKDPIEVHTGFYDYLDKSFDHVTKNLADIYEQYSGFELFVTGHSLGGALATLLSYHLASFTDKSFEIPLPVTCISYASPLVGNASFHKSFQAMERLNRLRHVRVTNEFDVVPLSPPRTGYVQTGVNVHLLDDGGDYEISYAGTELKPFWSQFRLLGSVAAHALVNYWRRGQSAETKYLDKLKEGKFAALYVSDLYNRFLESSIDK